MGKEYYVVYFDVLGYKKYLEVGENDEFLLNSIKNTIEKCKRNKIFAQFIANSELIIKTFSDNILMCMPSDNDNNSKKLELFVGFISDVQYTAFQNYNLLLRGGLIKGALYIDNDIVFGKTLVRAVEIEENEAIYPRIVVDMDVFNYNEFDSSLSKDTDGKYFVNYTGHLIGGDIFGMFKSNLEYRIKNDGYYRDIEIDKSAIKARESIIKKIVWLVDKYNRFAYPHHINAVLRSNDRVGEKEIVLLDKE